jgi:hypothetical protein
MLSSSHKFDTLQILTTILETICQE